MYASPAGAALELKLSVADTLLISARVVTCGPQFGNGIELLKMLPADQTKMAKLREHPSAPFQPPRSRNCHPERCKKVAKAAFWPSRRPPHNRLTAAEGGLR